MRLSALTVLLAGILACSPDENISPGENIKRTCQNSGQCAKGEVCWEGLCIIGECVVRDDCARPGDQMCELNHCVPDPNSPIGNECPNGDRDCDMGEFCSAGNCYDVSQSTPCRRSTDCGAGERCDPINGFCVEDRGGCNRASEYPELACPTGEVCDAVTGHCNPPSGIPCTPATVEADCGPSLQCIGNRCVQCTSNSNCGTGENVCCDGFGTQCNVATGRCVSAFVCSTTNDCTGCLRRPGLGEATYCADGNACSGVADCASMSARRCSTSSGECVLPECETDSQCASAHDSRWDCDPVTWRCFLPVADCNETNEPNNGQATATVVSGASHTDVLCRGDTDFMRIMGQAGKRLRVSVAMTPSGSGVAVSLLDSTGAEIDAASFGYSSSTVRVSANVAAVSPYFLVVRGNASTYDSYNYTVTVEHLEPLQCDSEPGEPNDQLSQASGSVLPLGIHQRALCGTDDVDYFQFVAPANLRTLVTVAFLDAEGDINIDLLLPDGTQIDYSSGYDDDEAVRYSGGTTDTTLVLMVDRSSYGIVEEEQEYTVEIKTEPLPDCADGFEPNNTRTQAATLTGGTVQATICDQDDQDWYAVDLPAGGTLKAIVRFLDSEGDLELKLLKSDGSSVDSSTTTGDTETVDGTNLAAGIYYIEVYPYSSSYPEPDRQPYSLELQVTHNCLDDQLGLGRNSSQAAALPLRDNAFASFAFDETLKLCSAADDWFRMLLLGDEFLMIDASGPAGLYVELYTSSVDGPVLVAAAREVARVSGQVDLSLGFQVPGRGALYYLRVGGGGNTERSYHLEMTSSLATCLEDPGEYNDVPALATHVQPPQDSQLGVLCPVTDIDMYRVAVASGTRVHAHLSWDGTQGNLDLAMHQGGEQVALSEGPDPLAPEDLHYTAIAAGDLYLSVLRHHDDPGDPMAYQLDVDIVGSPEDAGPGLDAGAAADAASSGDAAVEDAGVEDAAPKDAATEDAATIDSAVEDAAVEDAGSEDI
ncbi:MAG: PPC domain-containing protein [Pseudomonadota bacterium]